MIKLTCPKCDDHIANIRATITPGTVLKPSLFEWVNQELRNDEPIQCKKCFAPLVRVEGVGLQLHTNKGWLPE